MILLTFLTSGCAPLSGQGTMPSPPAKEDALPAVSRETMLEESREIFRDLFPEAEADSRFFCGTLADAEMILSGGGCGIILLGDTDPKKSTPAVQVLERLPLGNAHVLYADAGKERNLRSGAWQRFSEALEEAMAAEGEEHLSRDRKMELPAVLSVKNGAVCVFRDNLSAMNEEDLEKELRALAGIFENR